MGWTGFCPLCSSPLSAREFSFFVSKINFFFFSFLPSTTSHIRSMVNNGFLKSLTSLNTSTYGAGAPPFGNSIDLRDPISSDAIKPCETDGATECVHGKSNGHGRKGGRQQEPKWPTYRYYHHHRPTKVSLLSTQNMNGNHRRSNLERATPIGFSTASAISPAIANYTAE